MSVCVYLFKDRNFGDTNFGFWCYLELSRKCLYCH